MSIPQRTKKIEPAPTSIRGSNRDDVEVSLTSTLSSALVGVAFVSAARTAVGYGEEDVGDNELWLAIIFGCEFAEVLIVEVAFGVGVCVGVGFLVGVGVCVGVGVRVGVGVGKGVGVLVGITVARSLVCPLDG
jgi:hypothetical protein